MSEAWTFLGAAGTAILAAAAAIYTAWSVRKAGARVDETARMKAVWEKDENLSARNDKLQADNDALRAAKLVQNQRVAAHTLWDETAVEELRKKGVKIIKPPPLTD